MPKQMNRELAQAWYESLSVGDLEQFVAIHDPAVIYNIGGHTPISGQVKGIQNLMEQIVPVVFGALDMNNMQFCKRFEIVCADDNRAVGIMEADGLGNNGIRYDQRYVHMFSARDGKLTQVWEFFDTALANAVMFTDPELRIPCVDPDSFSL